MSQLIVSSRYLKSGSENKRKNCIKYIATCETVEIREQNTININAPASKKQQELISSLLVLGRVANAVVKQFLLKSHRH